MMKIGDAKAIIAEIGNGRHKSSDVLEAIKCVWGGKENKTRMKVEYAENAIKFLIGYIDVNEIKRS